MLDASPLSESIDVAFVQLKEICSIYNDRLEALNASLQAANLDAAKNAVKDKIKKFKAYFLLGYLAEQNFFPSAGIPTGLVEFNYALKSEKSKNRKLPTQHLSQAISTYAPGNQVVINEWCYQSGGIALKSKSEATKRNILQNCRECGYSQIVYGEPLTACPKCGSLRMAGLKDVGQKGKFTEIVEPAGFSVDWLGSCKPKRFVRNDNSLSWTQPLLLQMEPWPEKKPGVKIALRASTENSEILFYNSGTQQKGYMFCPYCGHMESETDVPKALERFAKHKRLDTGSECEGAGQDGARIRRNVLLTGRYQTDFVEVKFYDELDREITKESTLYSLGVIISRKLTEYLGVNDGEIDFGYCAQYHSIFIYDTALGGAGYSPLLRDYKNEVLNLARKALSIECCNKACTRCLVDRRSQWYLNYLDRKEALGWLEMEFKQRNVPDEVSRAFPDAETITSDWATEFYRVCRERSLKSVKIFIDGDLAKWNLDSFAFTHQIDLLKTQADCSYVVPQKLEFHVQNRLGLMPMLNVLFGNKFECGTMDLKELKPLLAVIYKDGHQKIYFGKDVQTSFDENWGNGIVYASKFGGELNFSPLKMDGLLSKWNVGDEGIFRFTVKEPQTSASMLFDTLCSCDAEKWNEVRNVFSEDRNVEIRYADKYIQTPLGCIILANLIAGIVKTWNLKVSRLCLDLSKGIYGKNQYGYNDFESDFADENRRNEFLKKCLDRIAGLNVEIGMENRSHARLLQIRGEKWTCEICPDAGVAWGWSLDRSQANLKLAEFEIDVTHDLKLFNKRKNDGILYTVAWQKNPG